MTLESSIAETATSASYDGVAPALSVVVSTFRRAHLLPALFDQFEQQDLARDQFEVVIADNASTDETWGCLQRWVAATPLAACVVRVGENSGPSSGRNATITAARGSFVAFTDDDCLPDRGWARHMLDEVRDGHVIIQGATAPPPGQTPGRWDRVIEIRGVTQLFEMCNLGFRRADLAAVGGLQALTRYRGGRDGLPFGGEDTLLGWRIVRATGAEVRFASDARVWHPIERRSFRGWLRARQRSAVFPALLAEVPELRPRFFMRWFFARRTAEFDVAVAGVLGALVLRSWIPLLAGLPYAAEVAPRARPSRSSMVKSAGLVLADVVTFWSLVRGSWHARRLLL